MIQRARVAARNTQTGVEVRTESNAEGIFRIPYLHPGVYDVSAEAEGFRRGRVTGVNLTVGLTATVDFALEAERWAAPAGPRVRWNEVRVNGRIGGHVLEISNFTLAGFIGVTTGTIFAATDQEWVITGFATASNIDVEAVLQALRPQGQGAQDAPPTSLQGTAGLNLTIVGRGASLDDAVGQSAISGPFQVRWATLNGINLGLAATQGATASGITRFTEFNVAGELPKNEKRR